MEICEPCQVGNEAALSRTFHVTWGFRGLEDKQSRVFTCQDRWGTVLTRGKGSINMNRIFGRVRRIALLCSVVLTLNILIPGTVKGESSSFSEKTGRLTKMSLTLNGNKKSDTAETYAVFNVSGDYALEGLDTGRRGIKITQENKLSYNGLPAVRITVSSDSTAEKGTSIINIIPIERNSGDKLKPLKLRVKIEKKYAVVGFQKKTVLLSKKINGEFALNSPTLSGAVIMPLDSEKYKPSIPQGVHVSLDNENTVRVSLGNTTTTTEKGKTKQLKSFKIKLWVGYADYNTFKAVPRNFTVKVTDLSPSVKLVKKAGSRIDLSQREATSMHYKVNVQNSGYVVKSVKLPDSLNLKYNLRTVSDPDSEGITDIYVSAVPGAEIGTGPVTGSLKMILQEPRQDAQTFEKTSIIRFSGTSSKLPLKAVGGKKLSFSQSMDGKNIVSYKEVIVPGKTYARINPDSIEEIKSDKVPKGAVSANWIVDSAGQAARVEFRVDKTKLSAGKNYKLQYRMRAVGAPANKYTSISFTLKI